MKISVYGAGYVGLVSAACFAKLGHEVVCVDVNASRVEQLKAGECPIYEIDLPELLSEQVDSSYLRFGTDLSQALAHGSVHFIAVGTPSHSNGEADLSQVYGLVEELAHGLDSNALVVMKSTVPVGTGNEVKRRVDQIFALRNKPCRIAVASNPEFLREGSAVHDFLNPDRVVIGGNERALTILKEIYGPLARQGVPVVSMSRISAELTKYATNAMLACRISFINQISRLSERLGGNIDDIRDGMALDHRIGSHFLQAGIGYGGSCFPKDTRALIQMAKKENESTTLFDAIESINAEQKQWVLKQLSKHFHGDLDGRTIGLWELAFKPGTDDIREASSQIIIKDLLQSGAKVRACDPAALSNAQRLFPENGLITWCGSPDEVIDGDLDALVIATEWPLFKNYPLQALTSSLGEAPVFDGRNCFHLSAIQDVKLAYYYSVGRPRVKRGLIDAS